ncbi:MAG: outer membrane beta-barrel protein [Pseudomonadota bacterium]
MFRVLATTPIAATIAASAIFIAPAYAADLDALSDVPVIEVPHEGSLYVSARISNAFAADTAFGLTAPAGGGTFTSVINDYENLGLGGSVAIGNSYKVMGVNLRAELEVGRSSTDVEAHTLAALPATLSGADAFGKTRTTYGLANVALDMKNASRFTPYVTGGLGYAHVEFKSHGVALAAATVGLGPGNVTAMNDSGNGLAWQVGTGVAVDVTDTVALEMGYEYFGVENVRLTGTLGDNSQVDVRQHKAELGFRLNF